MGNDKEALMLAGFGCGWIILAVVLNLAMLGAAVWIVLSLLQHFSVI